MRAAGKALKPGSVLFLGLGLVVGLWAQEPAPVPPEVRASEVAPGAPAAGPAPAPAPVVPVAEPVAPAAAPAPAPAAPEPVAAAAPAPAAEPAPPVRPAAPAAAPVEPLKPEKPLVSMGPPERGPVPVPPVHPVPAAPAAAAPAKPAPEGGCFTWVCGEFKAFLGFFVDPAHWSFLLALGWTLWGFTLPLRRRFASRLGLIVGLGALFQFGFYHLSMGEAPTVILGIPIMVAFGFAPALETWLYRCPRCQEGFVEVHERTLREDDLHVTGIEERTVHCPGCNYHDVRLTTIEAVGGKGRRVGMPGVALHWSAPAAADPAKLAARPHPGTGGAGRHW